MPRRNDGRGSTGATAAGLASLALALGACTGGVDPVGGDGDADGDGDGTFTGRVVGEMAGGARSPLAGVEVELLDAAGVVLDGAPTDGAGQYALTADTVALAFVRAHPSGAHAGQLRAGGIRDGLDFYDITLQLDAGLATAHEAVGLTYDTARGTLVLGFNPVDHAAGGEGGALDPASADPAFVLVDDGAVTGARLPPVCPSAGADPCVTGDRADFVFFPNVEPGPHRVRLLQPAGGTCALRFAVDEWLVVAHTSTIVEVDCHAD